MTKEQQWILRAAGPVILWIGFTMPYRGNASGVPVLLILVGVVCLVLGFGKRR